MADIICRHADRVRAAGGLSGDQRRVLSAIGMCRTPAMGAQLYHCRQCERRVLTWLSCRDRHCPRCQRRAREVWAGHRIERLLPVAHFQVVFTLPSELRPLARVHPKLVYGLLFSVANEVLAELAKTAMNARLGVTMVLHTWTREMTFHPHVHCMVTAGGLRRDDQAWVPASRDYLFSVRVMRRLFRARFLAGLETAWREGAFEVKGQLPGVFGVAAERAFARLISKPKKKRWVVHVVVPQGRDPRAMVLYLARYVFQIAIGDERIVSVSPTEITFRTKGGRTLTLAPQQFVRRYLLHVLPSGFRKIRHYGLYAPASVARRLKVARALLEPEAPEDLVEHDLNDGVDDEEPRPCPHCGGDLMAMGVVPAEEVHRFVAAAARGPPPPSRVAA